MRADCLTGARLRCPSHFPAQRDHSVYKTWMTLQQSQLCENAHIMRVNGAL